MLTVASYGEVVCAEAVLNVGECESGVSQDMVLGSSVDTHMKQRKKNTGIKCYAYAYRIYNIFRV